MDQVLNTLREIAARNPLRETFENGSTRSQLDERYDLIPVEADQLLAQRFGLGAERHSENGWKKGGVEFIKATVNHARAHHALLIQVGGNAEEDDDLAAILCNYAMLAWFRKYKPAEYKQALEGMS